jgi:hypothetical protein
MNHYLFDGKIHSICETQNITEKFSKREFVLTAEIEGKEQEVKFEFFGEQGEVLDNYKVGEDVTVAFFIRGNAYQNRHFVNLKAIAIGERIPADDKLREEKSPSKIKTRPIVKEVIPNIDDLPF